MSRDTQYTYQFPLPCHVLPNADINPRCSDVTRLSELNFFLTFSAFSTPPETYTCQKIIIYISKEELYCVLRNIFRRHEASLESDGQHFETLL